jgi:hydroxymethylpyrimidine/phosphomethylpyrimidine kinase
MGYVMSEKMVYALTIAGFDGSAGAGFISDIKTMAHFGVYGQAVCTALTEQNEDEFVAPGWVIWERIEAQLETLFRRHTFKFVKIGLVEKARTLKRIVEFVRQKSPDAFIVWDPIASASAGFHFMRDAETFLPIMKSIDLVTPNQDEYEYLGLESAAARGEIRMGHDFALLLKGGHAKGDESVDTLWYKDQQFKFTSPRLPGKGKHGTGCVLSSAILANVALGKDLPTACEIAKQYMNEFLESGEGRLGFLV